MTEEKKEFETIHRVIETKLIVVPEYIERFRYKDHLYSFKTEVLANESQEENTRWWMDVSVVLEEYGNKGVLLDRYMVTFEEFLKFSELKVEDMIGFYINNEIFSVLANNFINKEFKPNADQYYTVPADDSQD